MLFDFIRSDVIENYKNVRLLEMTQLLVEYLMSLGAKECKPSTKKHIKRNIEAEFNELIKFENLLNSNRVFLIPANLTPVQIARNVLNILMAEEETKVSAFAGRGKEQRSFQEMFDLLGVEWEFSYNLFQML
ncbi:unnamed protein product [Porites evermanni]|uniref:Uncharacterized protein n=1 Tax=Porites evermanni TaxID=104178 RepID=A0ABN8R5S3_9CNID|nr:unnamed protein product [Porites evermanni]